MLEHQMHDRITQENQPQHGREDDEKNHPESESDRRPQFVERPTGGLRREGRQNGRRQRHPENAKRKLDQPHPVKEIGGTAGEIRRENRADGDIDLRHRQS